MMYYVWHRGDSTADEWELKTFSDEKDVLKLLDANAGDHGFKFTVVLGHEVKFRPVSVAVKYERGAP